MRDDGALLREYAAKRSEEAFTELVRRHLGVVYSAALRQVGGDAHLAEDVAQTVFIDLSRKSGRLAGHTSLTGWLYTSARYAAATARRTEQRRQRRERETQAMNEQNEGRSGGVDWEALEPILDEALHALRNEDRHAVLLRFLEGKTLAEVGRGLGLNENAARKRVERAVEKLRQFFGRRGIAVSAAALSETLSSKAMVGVPENVARAVTAASLAAGVGTGSVIIPALKLMAITKFQIGAAAVAAAMATAIIYQAQSNTRLRQENGALRQRAAQAEGLRAENERLAGAQNTAGAQPEAGNQARELARLRAEVTRLRAQAAEAAKARREAGRMTAQTQAQEDTDPAEEEKQAAITRLNHAKVLMLSIWNYAEGNQGMVPTNFGQLTDLNGDPMTNEFQMVYQGSIKAITNPATTIVVREAAAQQTSSGN